MVWKKKLLISDPFLFEPFSDRRRRILEKAFPGLDIVDCTGRRERIKEAIRDAHLAYGSVSREEFLCARRLEFIQLSSQGAEHMQYPELTSSNVAISNARGIWSPAIAEHILALILAHYRKLPELIRRQQARDWSPDRAGYSMLQGRTVGFLGTGDIAQYTVPLLLPFRCRILGYNLLGGTPEHFETAYSGDGLSDMLGVSDVVVNILPFTSQTERFVSHDVFRAMKPTALFINIGRGKTVDEPALIEALQTDTIAAAALDVFQHEPLPEDSPLWAMPDVIITPHMAGLGASDSGQDLFNLLLDNLRRLRDGLPILNPVSKTLGY